MAWFARSVVRLEDGGGVVERGPIRGHKEASYCEYSVHNSRCISVDLRETDMGVRPVFWGHFAWAPV